MLEFKLKRSSKGKRSRWSKKYPRNRISHRGDEKYAYWFPHNWADEKYTYLHGKLGKFLKANLFRPVDKVFSEFLQRCRKGTEVYNLKKKFYSMFKNKEDVKYEGGFYLSNGIINFKEENPHHKYIPHCPSFSEKYKSELKYNDSMLPYKKQLLEICKRLEETHEMQLLGEFYVCTEWYDRKVEKKPVYVTTLEDYRTYHSYMKQCEIIGEIVGNRAGIEFSIEENQYHDTIQMYVYDLLDCKRSNNHRYIFVIK